VEEEFDPVRVADGIVVGDDGANVDRVAPARLFGGEIVDLAESGEGWQDR
jgi:hypothetical protein